ncbi:hypothetical protein ESCO_000091 [Escovopsis weberi]|uniref:Wax synthase domain-containing protein n=1 Tax=Escovopsis weberi TaxID=150374 RepID=A0A0M9VTN8_ESCWE|nr:hypothetical protein ESCO_000091 [Escovopsis weberi]
MEAPIPLPSSMMDKALSLVPPSIVDSAIALAHGEQAPLVARAACALVLYFVSLVPQGLLLNHTSKSSPLRFLWQPVFLFTSMKYLDIMCKLTTLNMLNHFLTGFYIPVAWWCFNVLIIRGFEAKDVAGHVYNKSDSWATKQFRMVAFFMSVRGINMPWEEKRGPAWPRFFQVEESQSKAKEMSDNESKATEASAAASRAAPAAAAGPTKGWWLFRQACLISWQYILLELFDEMSRRADPADKEMRYGPGSEWVLFSATREQWIGRIGIGLTWTWTLRLLVDMTNRMLAVAAVILGLSEVRDWPPLFGSVFESYTTRGFWSEYWHQYLRLQLTSFSNWFARDLLRLPRPSFAERYINIFMSFFMSGVLHVLGASYCGVSWAESSSIFFFSSFTVSIMLEDYVQKLWRGGAPLDKTREPPLWHKLVGYVWVLSWSILTAPWFIYPVIRNDTEGMLGIPPLFTLFGGIEGALGMLVGLGVFLVIALGARP